jgi:uncharacterized protein (DUF1778 family)
MYTVGMKMRRAKVKMGRPPVKNPRRIALGVKVTKQEAKAIRRMAAQAKSSVSTFILGKLLGGN